MYALLLTITINLLTITEKVKPDFIVPSTANLAYINMHLERNKNDWMTIYFSMPVHARLDHNGIYILKSINGI